MVLYNWRLEIYNLFIRLGQEAHDALTIFLWRLTAKKYKTFNQQLTVLRNRGLNVSTDGSPKRFLEQDNGLIV